MKKKKLYKRPTRLGSRFTVSENLSIAQTVLGEVGYFRFEPAERFRVKNGYVALYLKGIRPYPKAILLFSRGSFLELRTTQEYAGQPLLRKLRSNLWVPIHVGEDLCVEDHPEYVSDSEKEPLSELLDNL